MGENMKEDVIKVGKKSEGKYMNAVLYSFSKKGSDKVIVKGLGGANSTVFDVVQRLTKTRDDIVEGETNYFQAHGLEGVEVELLRDR